MLTRILALIKKEFLTLWNDPQSRILILIPPILQLMIFSYAINMEVKNIELGIWDRAQTTESRELISHFSSSKWFTKVVYLEDKATLQEIMDNQELDAAIEISSDFSNKIKQGQEAQVKLIIDGRQTNSAAIINGYVTQIIARYNEALTGAQAPLNIEIRHWYNPNLNFRWSFLATLLTILSTVSCLILTSMSIARERELGTFEQLLVSPLTSLEILIGKTIPPLCIATIISSVMIVMVRFVFQVPLEGSVLLLILILIITLLCFSGIGLFISSLCKTQQQALLGVFTFQLPAILLSGFISPIEDMPLFLQYLTYLNPLRFYMVITKGIFLKNMPLEVILQNLYPIILLTVVTLTAAHWLFNKKLE